MRTVAILQARLGSSRLPNKMLLPLAGAPLVQHVIERTKRATKLDDVVLAVPSKDAEAFAPIASGSCHLYAYPLDENDLVGRYLGAAQAHDASLVVRIPCDNPCVDPEFIDRAIENYMSHLFVFYSNTTWIVGTHAVDGVGAEVFSLNRLKWLYALLQRKNVIDGTAKQYREHPHKFFYEQGTDNESVFFWESENAIRLDVNTQDDYDFIRSIYDHFGHNRFTSKDVLAYLDTKKVEV